MKRIILGLTTIIIVSVIACEGKKNAQANFVDTPKNEIVRVQENDVATLGKPYVILVSIDGFRYDYAKRYGAKNLLGFDVSATKMISSFPTKTFPNHYAIVSGLYPGNNGLVSNGFYDRELDLTYKISNREVVQDPRFYNGTPLWVLASQQNMVTASMFWVGSEAAIQNTHPTYYFNYNGSVTDQQRVNQTIKWLNMPEKVRPHFITLYFSITDDVGHRHGPDSPEMAEAVASIDTTIGNLLAQVEKTELPVNVIVVSDHGMVEVDRENVIYPEDLFPKEAKITTSFPVMMYSEDSILVDSTYRALAQDTSMFHVYLRSNMPERFHYTANDPRVGDLILMPKPPYTLGKKTRPIKPGSSTHGYDPVDCPSMGAIFYANGPAFIHNTVLDSFENVHVYPLVAKILSLDYEEVKIDGSINPTKKALK